MRFGLDVSVQTKINQSAVLFLHAFPVNQDMWAPQMAALRNAGVPYLAFDYPGMGASLPWPHTPTIGDYADLAYRVGREAGIDQAIVVGLSMGGYVALALFRQHPEFFKGLILADTRATADPPEGRQRRYQLIQKIQQSGDLDEIIQFHIEKFFTAETRQKRPELVITARRLMQRATNQGVIHALQAMAERPDSTDLLPGMHFPVRVIVGEEDELTNVADSQKMIEKLPQGELITIPGAAHLSNLERPDIFNQALVDFVKSL
ncbi:MAG: alpha/beta fold hydrolase [Calditrichaeota bacterium]|nr:alpha/beta fold hydrolase [Calditrichota bacterium]